MLTRPFFALRNLGLTPQTLLFLINGRYIRFMRSNGPALLPVFRSQHQAELLAWLLMHPDEEFTVSDLAKRIRVPLSTVHSEVVRLEKAGLLVSRSVGRSRLVQANMRNRSAKPLRELLEPTFGPRAVIGEEFGDIDGADLVLIYGSWAARYVGVEGPPPNDIDVLVVGSVNRADVYEAADRAAARLGVEVNPTVRTREEWDGVDDNLLMQIKSAPHVDVADDQGDAS